MSLRIQRNVSLASAEEHQAHHKQSLRRQNEVPIKYRCGGRIGTISGMTLEDFAAKLGDPHDSVPREEWRHYRDRSLLDGCGKVSASWFFMTPRGMVEVGDYWWNRKDELSIRAWDTRSMRWFRRWCKLNSIPILD